MAVPSRPLVNLVGVRPRRSPRCATSNTSIQFPVWADGLAYRAGRYPSADPLTKPQPNLASTSTTGVLYYEPLAIPVPWTTDDIGVAYPADTWLLICGKMAADQAQTGWNQDPFGTKLFSLATSLASPWMGPCEFEVFGIPTGGTAKIDLIDSYDGVTIISTITFNAGIDFQYGSFPAEFQVGGHGRLVKFTFTGGSPTAWRFYDWHQFYAQFPIIPGSVPTGYTVRDSDDLAEGIDGFSTSAIVNARTDLVPSFTNGGYANGAAAGMGYPNPLRAVPRTSDSLSGSWLWSEVPDSLLIRIMTGDKMQFYTKPPHAVGTKVDNIDCSSSGTINFNAATNSGTFECGSVMITGDVLQSLLTYTFTQSNATATATLRIYHYADWATTGAKTDIYSHVLVLGGETSIDLGVIDIDPAHYQVQLWVAVDWTLAHPITTGFDGSFSAPGTIYFRRKLTPVPFSFVDSNGGSHKGAIDAARIRDATPTPSDAAYIEGAAGTTSISVPITGSASPRDNRVFLGFRPNAGPMLYKMTAPNSRLTHGEYELLYNMFQNQYHLSHGDGRRFFGSVSTTDTQSAITATIAPMAPVVTVIPSGAGFAIAAAHYTDTYGGYCFYKFTAPVDGTYLVSVSGAGTFAPDMGINATLALSLTDQLCAFSDVAQYPHDLVATASIAPGNTPPVTPGATIYIVGPAPTGIWSNYANQLAQYATASSSLAATCWTYYTPPANSRWGNWLWDGVSWKDARLLTVDATIAATKGQTVYVRVSGPDVEATANFVPVGATISWAAV